MSLWLREGHFVFFCLPKNKIMPTVIGGKLHLKAWLLSLDRKTKYVSSISYCLQYIWIILSAFLYVVSTRQQNRDTTISNYYLSYAVFNQNKYIKLERMMQWRKRTKHSVGCQVPISTTVDKSNSLLRSKSLWMDKYTIFVTRLESTRLVSISAIIKHKRFIHNNVTL